MYIVFKVLRRHSFGLMAIPIAPIGYAVEYKTIDFWPVAAYTLLFYAIFSFIYDFKPFAASMSESERISSAGTSYNEYINSKGHWRAMFYLLNVKTLTKFYFYYN